MTRLILALAALLMLAAAPAAQGAPRLTPVRYVLTPIADASGLTALQVEMRFTGDADGETRLRLPDAWAGETEFWRHVSGFEAQGASVAAEGPVVRVLKHRPGAPVVVRYRIASAYDRDPAVGTDEHTYRPVLRPTWFSVLGYATLAELEDRAGSPATLAFGPLPKGWRAASSAETLPGRALTVENVRESVSVGAVDLRIIAQGPLRIAVIGRWSLDLDAFTAMLGRVMQAERDYWGDAPQPFLVTLTPLKPLENSMSFGGTGMHQAFSIYAGTDTPLTELRWLVAHEHMHNWNPAKLGGLDDGEQEPAGYWFSEGFTDFLTDRTLLRSGVWSLEDFVTALNRSLREYGLSPARTEPNRRIVADFWKSRDVQRLPYTRGLLLAFLWDHELSAATGKDLDDVLKAQRAMAAAAPRTSAAALFPRAYREAGGKDLTADLDRYVTRGEAVLLPADLFGRCATVETVREPSFDRGFDVDATVKNDRVVTGVDPSGPSYAAGLRDGMKLKSKLEGEYGNSGKDYAYEVDDHGQTRVIRFRPAGKATTTVQRVVLTPGLDEAARAACVRSMSGV